MAENSTLNTNVISFDDISAKVGAELEKKFNTSIEELKKGIEVEKFISPEQMNDAIKNAQREVLSEVNAKMKSHENPNPKGEGYDAIKMKKFFDAVATKNYAALKDITGISGTSNSVADSTLIPEEFSRIVLDRADTYGILRQRATGIPMTSNKLDLHKLTSEPAVIWTGEGQVIKKGKPVFAKFALIPAKLSLIMSYSTEFMEDEAIGIMSIINRIISRQLVKAEDDMMFNGDGTLFMGIMNHPDVNVVTLASGKTAFTDITADKLLEMTDHLKDYEEASSAYYMHRTVDNRIKMLKDGIGTYIFSPSSNDIWGYQKYHTPLLPSVSASGAAKKFAAFGDLSNVYYGIRRALEVSVAEQATLTFDGGQTINMFEQDMKALRVTERIAIMVAVPESLSVIKTAAS